MSGHMQEKKARPGGNLADGKSETKNPTADPRHSHRDIDKVVGTTTQTEENLMYNRSHLQDIILKTLADQKEDVDGPSIK